MKDKIIFLVLGIVIGLGIGYLYFNVFTVNNSTSGFPPMNGNMDFGSGGFAGERPQMDGNFDGIERGGDMGTQNVDGS